MWEKTGWIKKETLDGFGWGSFLLICFISSGCSLPESIPAFHPPSICQADSCWQTRSVVVHSVQSLPDSTQALTSSISLQKIYIQDTAKVLIHLLFHFYILLLSSQTWSWEIVLQTFCASFKAFLWTSAPFSPIFIPVIIPDHLQRNVSVCLLSHLTLIY